MVLSYKCAGVVSAAADLICRNSGQDVAGNVAATGMIIAGSAEAAVKISHAPGLLETGEDLVNGAKQIGNQISAGASTVKCAAGKVCNAAGGAISNGANAAGNTLSAGASAVKCAAGKVCNAAGKVIGNAATAVGQAGSNLVNGGQRRPNDLEMGSNHRRRAQSGYRPLPIHNPEPEKQNLSSRTSTLASFPSDLETHNVPLLS